MNDMITPNPAEQQPGARFELDTFLSGIHLCVANLPPCRPEIKSCVERWFGGLTEIVVEKPSAAG